MIAALFIYYCCFYFSLNFEEITIIAGTPGDLFIKINLVYRGITLFVLFL